MEAAQYLTLHKNRIEKYQLSESCKGEKMEKKSFLHKYHFFFWKAAIRPCNIIQHQLRNIRLSFRFII